MFEAREAVVIPHGPDTKQGYNFVYVNLPLLALSIAVVAFRVWWRVIKNGGGALNKVSYSSRVLFFLFLEKFKPHYMLDIVLPSTI